MKFSADSLMIVRGSSRITKKSKCNRLKSYVFIKNHQIRYNKDISIYFIEYGTIQLGSAQHIRKDNGGMFYEMDQKIQ